MEDESPPVTDVAGTFTPWPRPVPAPVLGTAKKALLILMAVTVVHQFMPAGDAGSIASELFTIALLMSWLSPAKRVLARVSARRGPRG